MTDTERQYLVDRGLMKSRYQQRSSRLRDENNAMKVREQETGIKMTQPAKQVQKGTGSARNNTRKRLSARQALTNAFKEKGR